MQPRKDRHSCPCPCHYWKSILEVTNIEKCSTISPSTCRSRTDNGNKSADDTIIKPENDSKEYRPVTLPNQLKVIVISNPETEKAAAALSVLAGSMHDPEAIPGIAHFCEHMVFLGTEKYPEENFLGNFLSSNAGDYNAFTQRDITNYYFDVAPASLEQALDRFAQLFICPLFSEQSAEREVFAINSEHEKNIPNDGERRNLVDSTLSRKGHPYSKFDCGNIITLWTRPREESLDVMGELRKYFNTRYSANLMNLVVLGKESCDELQKIVERSFSPIKNLNLEVPSWPESPYGPDELATRIDLVPNMAVTSVLMVFPVPDQTEHYKTGAVNYIGFLLSHGGPSSLASLLKRKRWSNSGAYVSYERPGKGFAFLAAEIDLTSRGLDMIEEVVKSFFQYVEMIRSRGPQKWIWDEIKLMNDIDFRFAEKEEPITVVEDMATALPNVPERDILISKFAVIDDYQPELILDLLNLIQPTNMRLVLTSKENEDIANQVEEWYGAKYRYSKIDHALVQKWKMCGLNPEFELPSPNPLLPTNFDLKPRDPKSMENTAPRIISENFLSQVWFLQDNEYKLPQANILLVILTEKQMQNVKNYNLSELLVRGSMDSISEYCSDVDRAGMNFDLDVALAGFSLIVNGYDCKCGDLFEHILKNLIFFRSRGDRFEDILEDYLRELENFSEEEPYVHSLSYIYDLLRKDNWSNETLLQDMATNKCTANDLLSFAREAFSKVKLKWFFHGNFTEQEALDIYQKCSCFFAEVDAKPLSSIEWHKIQQGSREGIIPAGTVNIYPKLHLTHWNSASLLLLQCGAGGLRESTLLDLIDNILSQPAYDVLRTTEQLGYVVLTYTRKSRGALSLIVMVQGEYDPAYLDDRIENFLSQFSKTIDNLDEEQFRESVEALMVKKAEKPKTLDQYGVKLFEEIIRESYLFNRDELALKELDTIRLKDLQDFFYEWISPSAKKRKKLSIQVRSEVNDLDKIDQHSRRTPKWPSSENIPMQQKSRPPSSRTEKTSSILDSLDSKLEGSLGPPSALVENLLLLNRKGSEFSSRRNSGVKYFGSSGRKSGTDTKPHGPNVALENSSEAESQQDQDVIKEIYEGVVVRDIQNEDVSIASETEDSSVLQAKKLLDNFNASVSISDLLEISDRDAPPLAQNDNQEIASSEEKPADQTSDESQTEISGYFDNTSMSAGADGHNIKLALESSKSKNTRQKKKKPTKHRHKSKLHKKPSVGSTSTSSCYFYSPVFRRRKLFQSSHQLSLIFKKKALKVKPESDTTTTKRNRSLVHQQPGTSKGNESFPNDNSSTSRTLSSNSAEQVLVKDVAQILMQTAKNDKKLISMVKSKGPVQSPSTDSMLRSWVKNLIGPEIKKSKNENPKLRNADNEKVTEAVLEAVKKSLLVLVKETGNDGQRASGNRNHSNNRSSGNKNRWSGSGGRNNSVLDKPPESLNDSFYFNYKRKQTPPLFKQQTQKPLTSTPKTSLESREHENNLNWSVQEVEKKEPIQGFIRHSYDNKNEQPKKLSPNDPQPNESNEDKNNVVSQIHHMIIKSGTNIDLQPVEKIHQLATSSFVRPVSEEKKKNDVVNVKKPPNPVSSFFMMFTGGSKKPSKEHAAANNQVLMPSEPAKSPDDVNEAKDVQRPLTKVVEKFLESTKTSPPHSKPSSGDKGRSETAIETKNVQDNLQSTPHDKLLKSNSSNGEKTPKKNSKDAKKRSSSGPHPPSQGKGSGSSILSAVIRVHTNMMKKSIIEQSDDKKFTDSAIVPESNKADTKRTENLSSKKEEKQPVGAVSADKSPTDSAALDSDALEQQKPTDAANTDTTPNAVSELPETSTKRTSNEVSKENAHEIRKTSAKKTSTMNVENILHPRVPPKIPYIVVESFTETSPPHSTEAGSSMTTPVSRLDNVVVESSHKLPTLEDISANPSAMDGLSERLDGSTRKARSVNNSTPGTNIKPSDATKADTDTLPTQMHAVSTVPNSDVRPHSASKVPIPIKRNSTAKKSEGEGKLKLSKRRSPGNEKDSRYSSSASSSAVQTIVSPDRSSKGSGSSGSSDGSRGRNVDWSPSSYDEVQIDVRLGEKNHSHSETSYLEIPSSAVLAAVQSNNSVGTATSNDSVDKSRGYHSKKSKPSSESSGPGNKPPIKVGEGSDITPARIPVGTLETKSSKSLPASSAMSKVAAQKKNGSIDSSKAGNIPVSQANKSKPVDADGALAGQQQHPNTQSHTFTSSAHERSDNLSHGSRYEGTDETSYPSDRPPQPPGTPANSVISDLQSPGHRVNIIRDIKEWKSSLEYYPLPTPSITLASVGSSESSSCSTNDLTETDCTIPDQNLNNCQQMPCHFHYCPNHGLRQVGSCQNNNNSGTSWEIHVPQSNNFLNPGQYPHYTYYCHQQPR